MSETQLDARSLAACPATSAQRWNRQRRLLGVSPGRFFWIALPLVSLWVPFLTHRSTYPDFLIYSWDYGLFLLVTLVVAVAIAAFLARAVSRVTVERQVTFAYILLAVPLGTTLTAELVLGYQGRDVFARYREWGNGLSALMGFEAEPDHRWEAAGAVYTTDENHFRTHVSSRPRPEEECLIVTLGGSSTFGYGLNDDETWPHLLEGRLRERFGDRVTVLNAGNNGHNTLQQLIRLYIRVLPQQPDFVVYYGAINDVKTDNEADQLVFLPKELPEAHTTRGYLQRKNDGKGFYFENSLLLELSSRAFHRVYQGIKHRGQWPDPPTLTEDSFQIIVARFLRNLDSMRLQCEQEGAVFLPVLYVSEHEKLYPKWDVGIDYFARTLREHCLAHGYPIIDFQREFEAVPDKQRLFFEDHYHPSREGAVFLADHIAVGLSPYIEAHLAGQGRSEAP